MMKDRALAIGCDTHMSTQGSESALTPVEYVKSYIKAHPAPSDLFRLFNNKMESLGPRIFDKSPDEIIKIMIERAKTQEDMVAPIVAQLSLGEAEGKDIFCMIDIIKARMMLNELKSNYSDELKQRFMNHLLYMETIYFPGDVTYSFEEDKTDMAVNIPGLREYAKQICKMPFETLMTRDTPLFGSVLGDYTIEPGSPSGLCMFMNLRDNDLAHILSKDIGQLQKQFEGTFRKGGLIVTPEVHKALRESLTNTNEKLSTPEKVSKTEKSPKNEGKPEKKGMLKRAHHKVMKKINPKLSSLGDDPAKAMARMKKIVTKTKSSIQIKDRLDYLNKKYGIDDNMSKKERIDKIKEYEAASDQLRAQLGVMIKNKAALLADDVKKGTLGRNEATQALESFVQDLIKENSEKIIQAEKRKNNSEADRIEYFALTDLNDKPLSTDDQKKLMSSAKKAIAQDRLNFSLAERVARFPRYLQTEIDKGKDEIHAAREKLLKQPGPVNDQNPPGVILDLKQFGLDDSVLGEAPKAQLTSSVAPVVKEPPKAPVTWQKGVYLIQEPKISVPGSTISVPPSVTSSPPSSTVTRPSNTSGPNQDEPPSSVTFSFSKPQAYSLPPLPLTPPEMKVAELITKLKDLQKESPQDKDIQSAIARIEKLQKSEIAPEEKLKQAEGFIEIHNLKEKLDADPKRSSKRM